MSGYDDHHEGPLRPEPVTPGGLAQLLAQLAGPPDFWDRPNGDFGPLTDNYALTFSQRAHANSLYRLGSKALERGELLTAARWLGAAAEAGHPGALFRMAALTARAGDDEASADVRFLVSEAARHGHGDAQVLLEAVKGRTPSGRATPPAVEDAQFFNEVREVLGLPQMPTDPCSAQAEGPASSGGSAGEALSALGQLVLVPAPRLGWVPRPGATPTARPWAGVDARACHGRQLAGVAGAVHFGNGVLFRVPPEPSGPAPGAPADGGGEREMWWSAKALRPAVLTDMARSTPVQADTPQQWKTAVRALDILYDIDAAEGITTRDLTGRSGLAYAEVARLLDWLRGQHLISTVAGAHLPGPLMKMARHPERRAQLLRQALDGLRDQVGAAVYVSSYTDGDIDVVQAACGPQAPAVEEWVDFRDAAHASAVGKSLLAQLDFEGRMDHLSRYRPLALTERTITSPRALFRALDGHGPHAAQFDLLEYSEQEVCAAFPLGIPGRATCVALSLPAGQRHRLLRAAHALSQRSTGLLLTLLLTEDPHPNLRTPPQTYPRQETICTPTLSATPALPQIHAIPH